MGARSVHSHFARVISDDTKSVTHQPRALVVDDSEIDRLVAGKMLARCGYLVDEVGDVDVALELLGRVRFDLVLADIVMPEIDGFALLRRIRALGLSFQPSVIAYTGIEDRAGCLSAGFDEHLGKPLSYKRDEATLRRARDAHLRQGAA